MLLQINTPKTYRNTYLETILTLFFTGATILTALPVITNAYLQAAV